MGANQKATSSIKYALLPDYIKICLSPEVNDSLGACHDIIPKYTQQLHATMLLLGCHTNGLFYHYVDAEGEAQLIGGKDWMDVDDLYDLINRSS